MPCRAVRRADLRQRIKRKTFDWPLKPLTASRHRTKRKDRNHIARLCGQRDCRGRNQHNFGLRNQDTGAVGMQRQDVQRVHLVINAPAQKAKTNNQWGLYIA
jgi:hypothetical protein